MGRDALRLAIWLNACCWAAGLVPAKAGTCTGEGERTVLYLEYLCRRIDTYADLVLRSTVDHLEQGRRSIVSQAAPLVSQQVFWLLRAGLKDIDDCPAGSFARTIKHLAALTAREKTETGEPLSSPLLDAAWQNVVTTYAYCRAGALSEPSLCQALEFDPQLQMDCRRMVWHAAIFKEGRCDAETLAQAAAAMDISAADLSRVCEIFSSKSIGRCTELGEFQRECRAMLADDEKECAGYEDATRQKECLNELNDYRQLKQKDPPAAAEEFDSLHQTYLLGMWYPDRCAELAFRSWQKSAPPHLRLPPQP